MNKRRINLWIGTVLISILMLMMVVSLFYTPFPVTEINRLERFEPPSARHLLGTDNFGRDVLSRIMKGSQTAFFVGLVAVSIGSVFGVLIGAISGYFGGIVDEIIMRIVDAMMAFPSILLALMFVSVFGVGLRNTIIAIGIMSIPSFARITRSGFVQHKELDYVKNAKIKGISNLRIMFRHILPNVLSPIVVAASMGFANAVLAEAALSYLGLGIQPPNPSWGRMLSESQVFITVSPWYAIAPGIFITLLVLGFNFLGDGIRDIRENR
ncbi:MULTISPECIES: ABC transporter permease [Mesotoga]|jgi:peptide/nickel transport system permease protein|uniref:ABC-type dipeptide/oligopeptide/nickel transport system, permease component n=1 Tax=Mesotoga prima MesG1.Ag.4.2 TaxID=660470 RepID=I2F7B6_9BACT|nr:MULTISPECIES: ABC transporter permease [Mesotoga]MCP5457240.1 ABC transporter permease [Thermotogota bacterium]CCU84263.1 Dipeptide transport system permease protein dppC [Mesotoga infera]AFK07819.1 ABC-type dipeptide/oligopeptide/nickel transport system, permease component [Mesotoga prima MesG1.Ag.4.2]MCP5461113.1 ABC transporter permease [Thermotogota bacterium]PIJ60588.1 peptide ABC transporter permease [Mesotoga sp. H07.pep.5.3]